MDGGGGVGTPAVGGESVTVRMTVGCGMEMSGALYCPPQWQWVVGLAIVVLLCALWTAVPVLSQILSHLGF